MWTWLITLGSMALSAWGQHKQGQAAKAVGDSQAKVAEAQAQELEFNGRVADAQATDAQARGVDSEGRFAQSVRGLIGTQRTGYAGQGVAVDSGSAADVQTDASTLGATDLRTMRGNAQREANGFRVQAQNYRTDAGIARQGGEIARRAGQNAETAANLGIVSTVVGGTSSLLLQRYGWKDPGSTSTKTPAATRAYQGDALAGYANAA